ncbi:MAG: metallophosphoesterase [Syntrophothermus sp.]
MRKQWVIPDIHGCLNTLRGLLEEQIRPDKEDELFFLGDYIDRGPDSMQVIDYIRNLETAGYKVIPLKGNHEDFAVELYDAEKNSGSWFKMFSGKKRRSWDLIGGKETLKSFGVSNLKDIPEEYIGWMRGLRYYAETEKFVMVHAGMNFKIDDPFTDTRAMLWLREYEIQPAKIGNRRIIHGHVPVNMELIVQAVKNSAFRFIDLDNGPYIKGREGFGSLVALELTEMHLVIQDNRDL